MSEMRREFEDLRPLFSDAEFAFISRCYDLTYAEEMQLGSIRDGLTAQPYPEFTYHTSPSKVLVSDEHLDFLGSQLSTALDFARAMQYGNRADYGKRYDAYRAIWGALLAIAYTGDSVFDTSYDYFTYTWRVVIGPIRPEDPEAKLSPAGLLAWQSIARSNPSWSLDEVTQATLLVMA